MMFSAAVDGFKALDKAKMPLPLTLKDIRKFTLDEYGQLLLLLPRADMQHLSEMLPEMADPKVQIDWTGQAGEASLRQSVNFLNFVSSTFIELMGRRLLNLKVLDFGCGWGRLLRLLPYYVEPQNIFGCDARLRPLNEAKKTHVDRVASHSQSMTVPEDLPFPKNTFDLIYAFSVFTHLSRSNAVACLGAIRKAVKIDGIVIVTIWPLEFWDFNEEIPPEHRRGLRAEHAGGEYAFYPLQGREMDERGNPIQYGDTSLSLTAFSNIFKEWKILRSGTTLATPYQVFVVLKPTAIGEFVKST